MEAPGRDFSSILKVLGRVWDGFGKGFGRVWGSKFAFLLDRIFGFRVLVAGASGLYFGPSASLMTSKTITQRCRVESNTGV